MPRMLLIARRAPAPAPQPVSVEMSTLLALALATATALTVARPVYAQVAGSAQRGDDGTVVTGADRPRVGLDLTFADSSGLNAVGQNYRNELALSVEPRWAIGRTFFAENPRWKKLSLAARFVATRALAGTSEDGFGVNERSGPLEPCSNVIPSANGGVVDPSSVRRCNPTPPNRRTDYSDVVVLASLPRFATIPRVAVDVTGGARVVLPLSAQSRFATLRLGVAGNAGFGRGFLGGRVRASYSLGASKNFHAYSTSGLSTDRDFAAAEIGGNPSSGVAGVGISNFYADPSRAGGGGFATSYSFSNGLSATFPLYGKVGGAISYMWIDGFTYSHRCMVSVGGQDVDTCATGAAVAANSGATTEARGHRRAQVFSLTADYDFRPWLGFSLAFTTWSPREKPDTSYRQPFVSTDYNAFTSVVLSATLPVETVFETWRGSRRQP